MPSRPTETNDTTTTANGPMSSALAIFPRSSAAMVRAAFRIQKIIR